MYIFTRHFDTVGIVSLGIIIGLGTAAPVWSCYLRMKIFSCQIASSEVLVTGLIGDWAQQEGQSWVSIWPWHINKRTRGQQNMTYYFRARINKPDIERRYSQRAVPWEVHIDLYQPRPHLADITSALWNIYISSWTIHKFFYVKFIWPSFRITACKIKKSESDCALLCELQEILITRRTLLFIYEKVWNKRCL